MRRMNSMLLGHQGASLRTPCMYLRMASCVASSSHDSGSRTMRVGTSMSCTAGNSSSAPTSSSSSCASDSTRLSKCTCSDRIPGVRSMTPAHLPLPASHCISAWTRKRRARSSTSGPYSIEQVVVAARTVGDRGSVGAWRATGEERPSAGARRRATPTERRPAASTVGRSVAMAASCIASVARRFIRRSTARNAPCRRGRAGRSSTARPARRSAGQTKPPRLGPSGPRMIGMSPVKSMVPTA